MSQAVDGSEFRRQQPPERSQVGRLHTRPVQRMTGPHRDHQFITGNRHSVEVDMVGIHQRSDDEVKSALAQCLAQDTPQAGGDLEGQARRLR